MSNGDTLVAPARLNKDHDRGPFDCGADPLNEYLKRYALQNQKRGASVTYVAARGNRVVGYYTLAYGSIAFEDATESVRKGLGKYPIPVMLLARLAVDQTERGSGMGKALLKDALVRTVRAVDIAGLRAILVHAKDDAAKAFYERFDFEASPTHPYHLMLTVEVLKSNLGS
jgi:GNAT superfamily N-acetyltransferase